MACIMLYSRLLITGVGITMQMGMIRPERMGKNMGRRGMQAGQDCVIFDLDANFVRALQIEAEVGRCLVHGRLDSEARSAPLCLVDGARRDCRSNLDRAIRSFSRVCSNALLVH